MPAKKSAKPSTKSKKSENPKAAKSSAENHQFGADVSRLLEILVHSVYADNEVFLRELVSNAA
ncbi:MAG: hypothetical protein ACC634_02950, partial [Hyphomicrobiales bacterium]